MAAAGGKGRVEGRGRETTRVSGRKAAEGGVGRRGRDTALLGCWLVSDGSLGVGPLGNGGPEPGGDEGICTESE